MVRSGEYTDVGYAERKLWGHWRRGAVTRLVGAATASLAIAVALPGCEGGADSRPAPAVASSVVTEAQLTDLESHPPFVNRLLRKVEPGGYADLSPAAQTGLGLLQIGDITQAKVYTLPEFRIQVPSPEQRFSIEDIIVGQGLQLVESPGGDIVAAVLLRDGRTFVCSPDTNVDPWTKPQAVDTVLEATRRMTSTPGLDGPVRYVIDWGDQFSEVKPPTTTWCVQVAS